jgi:hypothetical protein
MKHLLAVPVVWLLALGSPLVAQQPEPAVGARVRVKAPSFSPDRLVGSIVTVDDSSLTLKVADRKDLAVIMRSSIEKLEVRRRDGKKLYAGVIGFLAGTGLGTILVSRSDHCSDGTGIVGCDVAFGALTWGVTLAAIGALAAPGERWEEVSPGGFPAGSLSSGGLSFRVAPRMDRGVEARSSVRF